MSASGPTSPLNEVLILLGSNLDPTANLPRAVSLLAEQVAVKNVSRVYESPPLDAHGQVIPSQGAYLNAAVLVLTDLAPDALKYQILRPIENELGRVRSGDKFAARTIDLDIVLYGDLVRDDPTAGLLIPDPDILTRAHVVLPLADVAPCFEHPITGQNLEDIAAPFAGQITTSALTLEHP